MSRRRINYRTQYPPQWREMVAQVRARSGDCCEGSPAYPDCRAENSKLHPVTGSIVMLTTAHLHEGDDTRTMTDIGRLAHQCQRCHLTMDAKLHARHAAETRRLRRIETVALCEGLGFVLVERHERLVHPLSLWQRRRQERGEQIVEREDVLAFKKGEGQV